MTSRCMTHTIRRVMTAQDKGHAHTSTIYGSVPSASKALQVGFLQVQGQAELRLTESPIITKCLPRSSCLDDETSAPSLAVCADNHHWCREAQSRTDFRLKSGHSKSGSAPRRVLLVPLASTVLPLASTVALARLYRATTDRCQLESTASGNSCFSESDGSLALADPGAAELEGA